jgi:hypothetical protein
MTTATRKTATPKAGPSLASVKPTSNGGTNGAPPIASKFAIATDFTPTRNSSKEFDKDLLDALDFSFDNKTRLSIPLAELPYGRRNILDSDGKNTGKTERVRDEKTSDSYIRRHAAERGYGVTVTLNPEDDRVYFLAQPKKIVASGANRAKRGSTDAEKAALKAQREANK